MKSGWKSTEFWISLAVAVLGSLLASGVLGEGDAARIAGAVLAGLAAAGYSASRGRAKAGSGQP